MDENANPVPTKPHVYDDIFDHVRSFGSYQRGLWVALSVLVMPMGAQFAALIFAMGTPHYHCATPNVTCPPRQCCANCTEYIFDGPMTSTVSEWKLICDRGYLGATLQSCFFVGMLIGSLVCGVISDAWGRKKCLFISYTFLGVAGVGSACVDCVSFFAFLRFVVGFGLTGVMLSEYVYLAEMVGPKRRTLIAVLFALFGGAADIFFVLIAYLIRAWRTLLLVYTVPAFAVLLCWRWIPESPRWLLAHGYVDTAYAVIMKYGPKKGQRSVDSAALMGLVTSIRRDQLKDEKAAKRHAPLDLLSGWKLRKWSFILAYQWFSVSLLYFGMLLFISQLSGQLHVNYFIITGLQFVSVVFKWILLQYAGRRLTHGACAVTAGVMLLTMLAIYKGYPLLTTALALVGTMFGNINWASVYLTTAELYPTRIRNIALGAGSTSARIGAILAPYVAMTAQLPGLSLALPVTIFGVVALLNGMLSYWLPETLFAKMHQTIEETEAAQDYYGIPCCGRPPERREIRLNGKPETNGAVVTDDTEFVLTKL
ncbi:organic cation transporter protein isoform X2 [Nematostella vectensis]|nr:organic cation transporter protein isoform X2 [Nematostella vectensis]XP_048582231.1 organic cation transporter protein isoform X2 [Nematostella vectensis]